MKQVKFKEHQDEIVAMMNDMLHLEPQIVNIPTDYYCKLESIGILKTFLLQDGAIIKGVILVCITPSLRNIAINVAQTDVLWVKPQYRGKSSEFISKVRQELANMGVNYWYVSSRLVAPIDRFLIKNQFEALETVFYQKIGE